MEKWPLPADYAAVLQNPAIAFRGPFLRRCQIDKDAHGLPAYSSWVGGSNVFFRAMLSSGQSLAVVAFTRPLADREERYRAISDHLERCGRPETLLPFQYHSQGIRSLDGKWYPMVTFEWPKDDSLFTWTRSRALSADSESLSHMAVRWIAAMRGLAEAQIAHGDLQHSTIRVTNENAIRLVGYDSMCVPELVGRPSIIAGQKPYQHPARTKTTALTLDLDCFPALLVLTVLTALGVDPGLWERYVERDKYDKMLIRPEDFQTPSQSGLYRDLANSPDSTVRKLSAALFDSFRSPITEVPRLSEVVRGQGMVTANIDGAEQTVFISAKSADYRYAKRVYHYLVEQGIQVFLSEESLPAVGNADYREAIDDALDRAKHMIVVTSSAQHVRAPWVKAEWGLFINEKRSGRKEGNLITVTVGDMQPSDLPASLRYYEVISLDDDSALARIIRYVRR